MPIGPSSSASPVPFSPTPSEVGAVQLLPRVAALLTLLAVIGVIAIYSAWGSIRGALLLAIGASVVIACLTSIAAFLYKKLYAQLQVQFQEEQERRKEDAQALHHLQTLLEAEQQRAKKAEEHFAQESKTLQHDAEMIIASIHRFAEGDLTVHIVLQSQNQMMNTLAENVNTAVSKIRFLVSQVQETVQRTGEIAQLVTTASHQITTTAEEQARQTTALAESVINIVSGISSGVEKTSNVERMAEANGKAAESGAEVTGNTVAKMQEIARVVSEAASVVRGLGNASAEVGEIVMVIEEIADQTNLLALNAAIEAARAGEQGRGFAVVADEVRKLAERTAQATKQIGGTIRHIQRETERAVKGIERGTSEAESGLQLAKTTGSALEEMVMSAGNVAGLVREVVRANEEQASTGSFITRNVEQMSASVEETASGINEIARNTEQLSNIVAHLQRLVSNFTIQSSSAVASTRSSSSPRVRTTSSQRGLPEEVAAHTKSSSLLASYNESRSGVLGSSERGLALKSKLTHVFENLYCGVFHDVEKKILEIHWTPQTERMTNEEFKEALLIFAELSEKMYTRGIFVNVLQNRHVLTPDLQAWHDANIVPRYAKAGIVKMAFLAPPSSLTRSSSEAAFEEKRAKELLQVLFFEEEEAAKSWLVR
ncbi:MAG: hypothetical protein JNN25_12325 [Candidatus Kapabacteria bacterium]|nr:hypothetical protein [Candidatus Kapabacteria bacterium]